MTDFDKILSIISKHRTLITACLFVHGLWWIGVAWFLQGVYNTKEQMGIAMFWGMGMFFVNFCIRHENFKNEDDRHY